MPSSSEHLDKARNNKRFADCIKSSSPTFIGWAITALFYSALHYVEAYNARYDAHFREHSELSRDIADSPVLQSIYDDYRDLSNFSWNARYNAINYHEAELNEAKECHEAVEKHLRKLLGV